MNPVKVGVIGAGGMGTVHSMKYAEMPDVEMHIYDMVEERVVGHSERFKSVKHHSMESIFEAVDAIDVCLPTDLHTEVGIACLEAKIPTLMEKPMAATVEECRVLMETAQVNETLLMPAQVVRFFPEYKRAHEVIAAGKIGKPASARMRRGGKAPAGFQGWFQDLDRSGGVLLDLAVHEFDWLRWTFGEVTTVMARSVRMGKQVQWAEFVGDYALITLTHEGGAVSHVEATWMDPRGFRTTLEISGSEGVLEFDSRQNPSLRTHLEDPTSRVESLIHISDDPYYLELEAFLRAARGEIEAPVKPIDGLRAVEIARAAMKSAETMEPVYLKTSA